jgi:predicted N-acetyltransferase YhbS
VVAPGSQLVIRVGTTADIEAIARVGSDAFRQAYSPHSSAADIDAHVQQNFSAAAVQRALAAERSVYYLARVGGEPAGIAKVRMADCPLAAGTPDALELQQLYVLADRQGHGVGRQLVARVFAHAEAASASGVWLSAWEFADWATSFYRRVGFEAIGKVQFKLGATDYTDLLMWRPLR